MSIVTNLYKWFFRTDLGPQGEWDAGAAYVCKGVADGWLLPRISKEYPLEEAPQAHTDITEAKEGANGKLLLKIYDD